MEAYSRLEPKLFSPVPYRQSRREQSAFSAPACSAPDAYRLVKYAIRSVNAL